MPVEWSINTYAMFQVIFNGKIVTPQSLLSRKPPAGGAGSTSEGPRRSSSWAPRDLQSEGSTTVSMMIEETEFPEKSAIGKAKRWDRHRIDVVKLMHPTYLASS